MAMHPKRTPGLHHIALRAHDFEATLRFYTAALGFRMAYSWGEGDKRIALLDAGDGNYLELFAGGEPPSEESGGVQNAAGMLTHFALRSSDVEADYARALEAGARPHVEPKDVPLQGRTTEGEHPITIRVAFCKGLNGEIIEFFQNEEL